MVGDDDHRRVRPGGLDQAANGGIDGGVGPGERGVELGVWGAALLPVSIETIPEVVLQPVRCVEDDAEEVDGMPGEQPGRRLGPPPSLLGEPLDVGEGPGRVVGALGPEITRSLQVDHVAVQLRLQLRRIGEPLAGRRQHAADDEAVHWAQGVGRRHVHHADAPPGRAGDVPERRRAQVRRVGEATRAVAIAGESLEGEDAVRSRVDPGHERRPRRHRERRHGRTQPPPASTRHEGREVRKPAGACPRLVETPRRAVEPDDQNGGPRHGRSRLYPAGTSGARTQLDTHRLAV